MAIYMVRGGRYGEYEEIDLKEGITTIGWKELPDLSKIESKEGFIVSLFEDRYDDMDYIIALEIFCEYEQRKAMR